MLYPHLRQNQVFSLLLRFHKWEYNQSTFNAVAFWRACYSLWLKYLHQARPEHRLWAKTSHMGEVTSFNSSPCQAAAEPSMKFWGAQHACRMGGWAPPSGAHPTHQTSIYMEGWENIWETTQPSKKEFVKTNVTKERSSSHLSTLLSFSLAFWLK